MVEGLRDLAPFFFSSFFYVPELVLPSVDRLWAGLWWSPVFLLTNPHHSWRETCFSRGPEMDGREKEAEHCRFSAAPEDADKPRSECSWTCDETARPATGAEDWVVWMEYSCHPVQLVAQFSRSAKFWLFSRETTRRCEGLHVTHPCNSNSSNSFLLLSHGCVTCRLSLKSTSMISASKFVIWVVDLISMHPHSCLHTTSPVIYCIFFLYCFCSCNCNVLCVGRCSWRTGAHLQLEMFTNIVEIIEFKIEVSLICPAGSPKSTLVFPFCYTRVCRIYIKTSLPKDQTL